MEKQWFNKQVKDVETELGTDLEKGLSNSQVEEHKSKYGLNELQEKKKESLLKKFIDQFKDFSIIVLIIAAIVSGVVGVAQGEGFTDTMVDLDTKEMVVYENGEEVGVDGRCGELYDEEGKREYEGFVVNGVKMGYGNLESYLQ